MYRLHLLGRVDLIDERGLEVGAVLAQPRRLALLAYLASHSPETCSRDRLLGLFWPEESEERARKALNKALHFLREQLGERAIVSHGSLTVGIEPKEVWCDVPAFLQSVQAERLSEAVDFYRGDLLPSFYIEDAPEFEAWIESERSRLRRHAARATNSLARQREIEGQMTVAIGLARRAVDMADEDERAVRQLLELLDRLGDRAGALYAYDKFARRLAIDFGVEPAAETKAVMERIRTRSEPAPQPVTVAAPPVPPMPAPTYTPHSEQSLTTTLRARGYVVERELGRGGMATVYLATDLKHDRQVALKVLSPELGALRLADRFAAEIKLTARLNHPNILPLFDSGAVDGVLYYAMPYVQGESLRARLDREKQLSVEETVRLVAALGGALQHAHQAGVIHRDIKPENVLLQEGRPLLADFGIALALSSAGVERITSTGLSLGTPQYMSPEQAAGELMVGPASDIYSLGAVAYEMLAGEPPFTGPNTRAVLARVMLEEPRPIRTIRSTVPPQIETAIVRALAKHPADRFASARDFATALAGDSETRESPDTGSRRQHIRLAAALSAVVLVGVAMSPEGAAWVTRWFDAAEPSQIVVADFVVPPSESHLGPALRDVVSGVLQQASGLTIIPRDQLLDEGRAAMLADSAPLFLDDARHVAHRARVPALVDGRIHRIGERYGIVLTAVNVADGTLLASEQGSATNSDLSAATERLASALAVKVAKRELQPLPDIHWRASTPSPEAYRLFVAGYTDPNIVTGAATLEQALRLDSAFATARAQLAYYYAHIDKQHLVVPSYREALQQTERLTDAERLYAQAMIAYRTARPDSAVALFEAALQLNPSNAELRHDRGMALRALERYDDAAESFGRAAALKTSSPIARSSHLNSLATTLAFNGNVDSARVIARQISDSSLRLDADLYVAIAAADWAEARRIARATATDPTTTTGWRRELTYAQAATLVAQGQLTAARRLIPSIGPVDKYVVELAIAVGSGDTTRPKSRAPTDTMSYDFYFHAARNAWRGDSTASRPEVRALRPRLGQAGNPVGRPEMDWLEGWSEPGLAGVRRMIDFLAPRISSGKLGSSALVRFLVADGYERLGQLDSAAVYFDLIVRPRAMHFRQSLSLGLVHSFALRRLALVYERLGERKKAREHWEWFLRSFASPDPELRPLVDEARQALR